MFRLFHSIFGNEEERYPDTLVDAALERAVDGTDPWLRGLSGYRRKLRPAVVHALDHVVGMTDGFEQPLELSRTNYATDPQLRLFFISPEQLDGMVCADPLLAAWRAAPENAGRPAWALLVMECEQRRAFGVELQGDTLVRDVPQITVSFSRHRLLDPAASLEENRRLLRRRAFDHLLTLALARIVTVKEVREDLLRHRTLLQAKHDMLEGSGWGFGGGDAAANLAAVHQQLDEIAAQLQKVGGDDRYIEKHLEVLVDVLANAERQLWMDTETLIVDRMGIKRGTPADDAPELELKELHNAAGRRLMARMVVVPATAAR